MKRKRLAVAGIAALAISACGGGAGTISAEPDRGNTDQSPAYTSPVPTGLNPSNEEALIDLVEVGASPDTLAFPDRASPFAVPSEVISYREIVPVFVAAEVPAPGVVIVEYLGAGHAPCDAIGGVDALIERDTVVVTLQRVAVRIADDEVCFDMNRIHRVSLQVPNARPEMSVVAFGGQSPEISGLRPGWERRAEHPTDLSEVPKPNTFIYGGSDTQGT